MNLELQTKIDKKELSRIQRAVVNRGHYSKIVEGVHTWDVAEIFNDFRAVIQIARRALRSNVSDSKRRQ